MAELGTANIGGRAVPAWVLESTAEQVDNSKWFSKPNLLDNWYFPDPINQRGVTAGTAGWNEYFIDMWSGLCEYTLNNGFMTLATDGYIVQKLESAPKYPFTASILTDTGLFVAVFAGAGAVTLDGFGWVDAQATPTPYISWHNVAAANCIAAKLELGSRQTLAHQDASGNWVLNDPPPNKALELAKCQRYLYVYPVSFSTPGYAATISATEAQLPLYIANNFRAKPVFAFLGASTTGETGFTWRGYGARGSIPDDGITVSSIASNMVLLNLKLTGTSTWTANQVLCIRNTRRFLLSAEL